MPGLSFKLTGFDLSDLKQYAQDVQDALQDELDVTAIDIARDAKEAAPVDLGALRASIFANNEGKYIRAGATVEYAPYVEFGTGTFVDINPPISTDATLFDFYQAYEELQQYALQFKGRGIRKVNLPPRPFMFPAIYNNYQRLLKSIATIMNEAAVK